MLESPDEMGPEDLGAEIVPQTLDFDSDCPSVSKGGPAEEYVSLVREDHLPRVMADCEWGANVEAAAVGDEAQITHHTAGFSMI